MGVSCCIASTSWARGERSTVVLWCGDAVSMIRTQQHRLTMDLCRPVSPLYLTAERIPVSLGRTFRIAPLMLPSLQIVLRSSSVPNEKCQTSIETSWLIGSITLDGDLVEGTDPNMNLAHLSRDTRQPRSEIPCVKNQVQSCQPCSC